MACSKLDSTMMLRRAMLLRPLLFMCLSLSAQDRTVVDEATADAILSRTAATFPTFNHELLYIKAHDPLVKQVNFVLQDGRGNGPAFASPHGTIDIVLDFLEHPRPHVDDNRMVVVLYHELGHLHYFQQTPRAEWTPAHSEQAAFEYSLLMTKGLAEKGNCGPLAAGVKFMKIRSEGTNLADAHVRALKRMVNEPLYATYVKYVQSHCTGSSVQVP